jgi:hypothetical protein
MDAQATAKIPCAFTTMPDPRNPNRRHKLIDILTIALFAVMAGADGWAGVANYGRAKAMNDKKTWCRCGGAVARTEGGGAEVPERERRRYSVAKAFIID